MAQNNKAFIAMSGGVDSSVAAHLAIRQGQACVGGIMLLHSKALDGGVEDARTVAERLGLPFHVIDATDTFRTMVMDRFVESYEQGHTPNPCVECNRHLKFGYLLHRVADLGCSHIVTGHYAQVKEQNGRYLLYKAADLPKDQSYFLYALTQHQLAHTLFPLGGLTKEQVRAIAQEQGFGNAQKRDSQDICFVPKGDYMAFLQTHTGKDYPAGDFLDRSGNTVGRHRGAVAYTTGQRKGLGLAMGEPVYVYSKDMERNTVTVGSNEDLFRRCLRANDWNWIACPELTGPIRVKAKARSRMTEQPATVYPEENGICRVEFDQPQRALTTGQAVVLYDGDLVIGGGTITEVL